MVEIVCAKLHMDLAVFINSRFRQNSIHDPLLQQKHLISLLLGLRIGIDQFSHLYMQVGYILFYLLFQIQFCESVLCSFDGYQPTLTLVLLSLTQPEQKKLTIGCQ